MVIIVNGKQYAFKDKGQALMFAHSCKCDGDAVLIRP